MMSEAATLMHQSYRNHATIAEPLRNARSHLPLFVPATNMLPWDDEEIALFCLNRDRNNLVAAERNYAAACAALGAANRPAQVVRHSAAGALTLLREATPAPAPSASDGLPATMGAGGAWNASPA